MALSYPQESSEISRARGIGGRMHITVLLKDMRDWKAFGINDFVKKIQRCPEPLGSTVNDKCGIAVARWD